MLPSPHNATHGGKNMCGLCVCVCVSALTAAVVISEMKSGYTSKGRGRLKVTVRAPCQGVDIIDAGRGKAIHTVPIYRRDAFRICSV